MDNQDKCPTCGKEGQKVANFTVQRFVQKEFRKYVVEDDFYLCMEAKCEVGYFNNEIEKIVLSKNLKRPLWYKEDAESRLICHCTIITEEDIIKTVIETDLKNMRHIMFYLKERFSNACGSMNPLGKCCVTTFNEVITKARRIKQNIHIQSELNPNLLDEIQPYLNLKENSVKVDINQLDKEIMIKEPTSTCGMSKEERKSSCC